MDNTAAARAFRRPLGPGQICPYKVVIYDSDLANADWKQAFMKLKAAGNEPCILLASRVYDQYLWNEVIRCDVRDEAVPDPQLTDQAGKEPAASLHDQMALLAYSCWEMRGSPSSSPQSEMNRGNGNGF